MGRYLVDTLVAEIASRRHGVISHAQLRMAGLSEKAIRYRVATGRLHRIHHGVYAVGHPGLSQRGTWKAATMACGEGAVLSHRSAAELWGMLDEAGGAIHVTVPVAGGRAQREGVRIHRRPSLAARRTTSTEQAEVLGLPIGSIELFPDRATSQLELDFLTLCRRQRIAEPEVDVWIGPDRVDFLWRAERLIVEADGYRYHRGRVAFEDDRSRENRLMAAGYDVLRFTYERVLADPGAVADTVRARLALAQARSRPRRS